MKTISIVIPFHNEEQNLEILLPLLASEVNNHNQIVEVLLIDDVSEDDSKLVVQKFVKKNKKFKLVELDYRSGQTGAFKKAFQLLKSDFIIRMDADLQDDPVNLPKFIEYINKDYDVIIGVRMNRSHPLILIILSKVYDLIFGMLFKANVKSNSGSFIAFRTFFVKDIPFKNNDHRYLPLIAFHRGAKKVYSLNINHNQRKFGSTKYKIYKKVLYGGIEALLFYIRLKRGFYNKHD